MKIKNPFLKDWHDDPPTKQQLDYIKHIWEECEYPLPPFTGKTKGEAAIWIDKNKRWAYCSSSDCNEGK